MARTVEMVEVGVLCLLTISIGSAGNGEAAFSVCVKSRSGRRFYGMGLHHPTTISIPRNQQYENYSSSQEGFFYQEILHYKRIHVTLQEGPKSVGRSVNNWLPLQVERSV